MRDGDVVLFFNFRADRARQLSLAFLRPDFKDFDREITPQIRYVTLTEYDETYGCPVVFGPESLQRILGEVVSEAGLKQLCIAETGEASARPAFNGGTRNNFPNEDRVIVLYRRTCQPILLERARLRGDAQGPERLVPSTTSSSPTLLVTDMVGHTGVVAAAIKAVEYY